MIKTLENILKRLSSSKIPCSSFVMSRHSQLGGKIPEVGESIFVKFWLTFLKIIKKSNLFIQMNDASIVLNYLSKLFYLLNIFLNFILTVLPKIQQLLAIKTVVKFKKIFKKQRKDIWYIIYHNIEVFIKIW